MQTEPLEQITEFKTSPELIGKLYEYSIRKEYEAGSVILDENASIRSIPL
jgi:CRP/FNR family transcriptional regulator